MSKPLTKFCLHYFWGLDPRSSEDMAILVACSGDHVNRQLWACTFHNLRQTRTSTSQEIATFSEELVHGWLRHDMDSDQCTQNKTSIHLFFLPGLGRVPDLRVLVICVSLSPSPSTWLLHEYESEYEYWLMSTSTSTSTGLWSTFYIGISFSFFGLWQDTSTYVLRRVACRGWHLQLVASSKTESKNCAISWNVWKVVYFFLSLK